MNTDNYIKERLNKLIEWYDKKSIFYKKAYFSFNIFIAVLSAITILLTTLSYVIDEYAILFSIGALISTSSVPILIATNNLMKCQELYRNYRSTCEMLKQEKILYQCRTGEYENYDQPEKLLVRRCESIMSTETNNWTQLNEKKD